MKLYQSFRGEKQRAFVSGAAIPFEVQSPATNDAREYELLKAIWAARSASDGDAWGLVSWKFQHKSLIPVDEFIAFAESRLAAGCDCAYINPMVGNEAIYVNVWEQGIDQGHIGLGEILAFLRRCTARPLSGPMGSNCFAFCNYFVARAQLWQAYFTFVDHVLAALEDEKAKNSEVGRIYAGSASYARDANVTMRPFVIERLFSSFIAGMPSHASASFEYPAGHFRRKFGETLGTLLGSLSARKNAALKTNNAPMLQDWHRRRSAILQNPIKAVIWQLDDPPLLLAAA